MSSTDTTPRTITRDSPDWPSYAPAWASSATFEPDDFAVTFSRSWSLPGVFRDMEPLVVVQVVQEFVRHGRSGALAVGNTRVVAGPGGLWTDYRSEAVATALREIAEALSPQTPTMASAGAQPDDQAASA